MEHERSRRRWITPVTAGRLQRVERVLERVTGEAIDSTSLAGVQKMVTDQVPESSQLDFKVDAYDGQPKQGGRPKQDEFRKDVTALANARGGVLLLGMAEVDGVASHVAGVSGSFEAHEGRLRSLLQSRIEPYLEGVEIKCIRGAGTSGRVGAVNARPFSPGTSCIVVLIPPSPRRPHAVVPMNDNESLKYARRVGRHTEWLSEAQVADLYRERFTGGRDIAVREDVVESEASAALLRGRWLAVTTVPDEAGDFAVDGTAKARLEEWWLHREQVRLNPHVLVAGGSDVVIGPRRVVLEGRDATSAPSGNRLAFHHDGSTHLAFEIDGPPSGNPTLFLDHAVALTVECLATAAEFTSVHAATGGLARVRVRLLAPETPDLPVHCYDPSWSPVRLQPTPQVVMSEHTIDLDSVLASRAGLFEAAGIVGAGLAQHFGVADGRYISASGVVRVQQFDARTRDRHVIPLCVQLNVPIDRSLGPV